MWWPYFEKHDIQHFIPPMSVQCYLYAADCPPIRFGCCPSQLDPWKMEGEDTKLLDLIPFLEAVHQARVPDVRPVIQSYAGEDIPTAFMERMIKLQQQPRKPRAGFLGFSRS